MKLIAALSVALLICSPLLGQGAHSVVSNSSIEKTVVAALSFQQGDLTSLKKAQQNFTPKAWGEFMKTMQGFLEPNGAPTFTSQFVPAEGTVVISNADGTLKAKIPGTLTQTHDHSKTTYRLRIEVETQSTPPKISHLEQITCPRAAAANYCM